MIFKVPYNQNHYGSKFVLKKKKGFVTFLFLALTSSYEMRYCVQNNQQQLMLQNLY